MNLKKVVAAMSVASGLGLVFGGAGSGVAIAAPCPPGGVAGAQCGGPGPGPQGGPPSAPQAGAAPPGRQEPPTDGAGNFRGLDGQQPDLPRRRPSDSPRSDFPGSGLGNRGGPPNGPDWGQVPRQDWGRPDQDDWRRRPPPWGDGPAPWGWGPPPRPEYSGPLPPPWGPPPPPINYWGFSCQPVWDAGFNQWGIWFFGIWIPL
ncbi:MAG TPA: chitin-binding protein [Mycobacterium sp.]